MKRAVFAGIFAILVPLIISSFIPESNFKTTFMPFINGLSSAGGILIFSKQLKGPKNK